MPEVNRRGSFTSYLFQAVRCDCPTPDGHSPFSKPSRPDLDARHHPASVLQTSARLTRLKLEQASLTMDSIQEIGLTGGDVIGGNYQIFELIGEGGMGLVFLGKHIGLDRTCAVKVLAPSMLSVSSWMMFQNEAKIIAGLNHKSICQVYDLGVHKERLPFYAMDYLPGKTLEQLLAEEGTLSVGAVVEIFLQLAEGLAFAHGKGVIHRDIKPANIMLVPEDSNTCVKLLDFGIAELAVSSRADRPLEDIVGTTFYMSPERFAGTSGDSRADIYAVGCSMFEALTGTLPFENESLIELRRMHEEEPIPTLASRTGTEFSPSIEAVVRKCLAKTPEDRYQTAAHLQADLACVLSKESLLYASPAVASSNSEADASSKSSNTAEEKPRSNPALLQWTAIGLLVLTAGFSIYNMSLPSEKKSDTAPRATNPFSADSDSPLMIGETDLESSIDGAKLIEDGLKRDPTRLTITGSALPSSEVMVVSRASNLRELKLVECKGDTRRFFEHIVKLPIANLEVSASEIDDETLAVIAEMKSIRIIHFSRCPKISDAGITHLTKLPGLLQLSLSAVPGLTAKGLRQLKSGCKDLRLLELSSNPRIDDRSVEDLKGFGGTTLDLDWTGITDKCAPTFATMPNLVTLSLCQNTKITDKCLPDLSRIKQLIELYIEDTSISGYSKDWKKLKHLKKLYVGQSIASKPAELEALKAMLPAGCVVRANQSNSAR